MDRKSLFKLVMHSCCDGFQDFYEPFFLRTIRALYVSIGTDMSVGKTADDADILVGYEDTLAVYLY